MNKASIISIILIFALLGSCAPKTMVTTPSTEKAKTYTTSFPTRDVSRELKNIQKSVKRISATGIYATYYIDDRLITREGLKAFDLQNIASRKVSSNESTAGTAISIFENQRQVALLTNAHVVNFPDTLISYIERKDVPPNTFVKSIKIKQSQNNIIYDLPNIGRFDIIGLDEEDDLSLLKVSRNNFPKLEAPLLPVTIGNPADLEWGSFVYIIGYPKGYPMITRGIVSDPRRNSDDDFLTDALFNPGISGGLMIATRDNFNTFEWVGMTNTASADLQKVLVPNPIKASEYQTFDPYLDSAFVEVKTQLTYGITQSIPMKKIIAFLQDHERALRRLGFHLNRFRIDD